MAAVISKLRGCLAQGGKAGLKTAAYIVALVVPISLAVMLLGKSGVLAQGAQFVAPVFAWFGLPEATAVAFFTGALVNCYSGIAALGPIPLTDRALTILALMILICHNLPVECAVQKKTGSSALGMAALRVLSALVTAVMLNAVLPQATDIARARGGAITAEATWAAALLIWAKGTGWLVLKMVVLIVSLTVITRLLEAYGVVRALSRILAPLLFVLGVPRRASFLWMVANTLGLAFGAAVILDEVGRGNLTKDELRDLNRSIAVCHSLLEDTLLFVAVGASALWITVPRLLLAALVVWGGRAAKPLFQAVLGRSNCRRGDVLAP